jgi:Ser/Thr protein kinase RdoA (MazF antagonist)
MPTPALIPHECRVTDDTTPQFAIADAVAFAHGIYGLTASASTLPSERDQNFALEAITGEKYILKISKSDEERSVLELQNEALMHAAERAPNIALPRLIPAVSGEAMVTIRSAHGRPYLVRLLTWLDGEIFVHALPHDASMLASLGAVLGEVDRALQGFSHSAMHRELHWDVKRADLALEHLSLLPPEQQSVVRHFMHAWSGVEWKALRHSLIHGDANDYNVLVREGRVVGLLDFGDIVYSAVVCDLAIALAYALLDQPDPLKVLGSIISAYHGQLALSEPEIDALYPLMTARLCMSLCYAAYNAQVKSGDAYQLVTAGPAWTLLQRLICIPQDTVRNIIRRSVETL